MHSFILWGTRGQLLRPRRKTQPSLVIGARSAACFGQNGAGAREGCTFIKHWFSHMFSKIHATVVFSVPLGAPGPLRAPSGVAPGAQQPAQGPGHFEAVNQSCLLLPAGSRRSHRARNTMEIRAESLRRDRRVFKTLVKHRVWSHCGTPGGPKL